MIFSSDPRGIAAASRGMANRADATGLLPEIDCPTLLIAGQRDQIVPVAEMHAMAEAMPHARLVEISNAGHLTPLENPAEVNAAMLSFLGELR
jgi:pimeloyl-ACP methyl ester carboxylesterase